MDSSIPHRNPKETSLIHPDPKKPQDHPRPKSRSQNPEPRALKRPQIQKRRTSNPQFRTQNPEPTTHNPAPDSKEMGREMGTGRGVPHICTYIYINMYCAYIDGSIVQPWHLRYTEIQFLVSRYPQVQGSRIQTSKNPRFQKFKNSKNLKF